MFLMFEEKTEIKSNRFFSDDDWKRIRWFFGDELLNFMEKSSASLRLFLLSLQTGRRGYLEVKIDGTDTKWQVSKGSI